MMPAQQEATSTLEHMRQDIHYVCNENGRGWSVSLPKTSRALKITMEPHRRHAAATDSCCCSGIHAGRRRRASSGANFAQFGTSPARTRCAMSIAFEMCAAHLQRAAHDLSQSSTGRTVRPQSVPNRASARNRDNFADSDILRLEGGGGFLLNLGGVPLKLYSAVSCVYPDVS